MLLGLLLAAKSTAQGKPDINLIMADDMGWSDIGCFGALHVKTPNIGHIAFTTLMAEAGARLGARKEAGYCGSAEAAAQQHQESEAAKQRGGGFRDNIDRNIIDQCAVPVREANGDVLA